MRQIQNFVITVSLFAGTLM